MTTKETTYEIPNIGCLLGIAFQTEVGRLTAALEKAALDVTAAEYLILRILFTNAEIQQCEISRILHKDKASISRSIRSLSRKGYVAAASVNYKCSMVSLTDAGKALKPRLLEVAETLHHGLAERLTAQQMESLREILKIITK